MTEEEKCSCMTATVLSCIIIAILMFFMLALSSCKTCQCVPERVEVEKEVVVTKHDSIIVTDADSASALALMHCDSLNQVVMDELLIADGDRLSLRAKIRQLTNGVAAMDIQCHEDSLQHRIEWLEKELREKHSETIVVKERYVPPFYVFCLLFFIVVCLAIICTIAFKVIKTIYLR